MTTPTLTEFLLARIAEDEVVARSSQTFAASGGLEGYTFKFQPVKILAECDAKRRIVEMQAENDEMRYLPGFHYKAQMIESVLRTLALPYANHPGYRKEWRL